MPLPEWLALHNYWALCGVGAPMPWDTEDPIDEGIAAEAEEFLRQHSAMREPDR